MIVDLPGCTVNKLITTLSRLRLEGGIVAVGRVLTLVAVVSESQLVEEAITDANAVSREHPMRIIVVHEDSALEPNSLNAQIRVGSDAGASEVIVLSGCGAMMENLQTLVTGLLLPDVPLVTWWVGSAPEFPAKSDIGQISDLRITNISQNRPEAPEYLLKVLVRGFADGNTDLAWSRLSLWRSRLASMLDYRPDLPVTAVRVSARKNSLPARLLSAWLEMSFELNVDFTEAHSPPGDIESVTLVRADGEASLKRSSDRTAILSIPGFPANEVSLPITSQQSSLAEELRMLETDRIYGGIIRFLSVRI